MTPLAVALALAVGASLGFLGGGGAILAVPVFVYALGVSEKSAIPMSLIVVGSASLVGAMKRWHAGHIRVGDAVPFALTAMVGAYLGGRVGVLVPERVQMSLFAIVIGASAARMLWSSNRPPAPHRASQRWVAVAVPALIGGLTGLIGIGGGFLFVPALVSIFGIPMIEATGLSLMVISLNSAAALYAYHGRVPVRWDLVLPFAAVVMVATWVSSHYAARVPVVTLQRTYAGVLLAVSALMMAEHFFR